MSRRMTRRGFTLIEILIVIVLVAVLSGVAVPKVGLGKYRSDAAARLLVSVLQQSERLAMQRQHDVVISFDTTRHRIRVLEDRNNNGALDAGERVKWRTLEERERFANPPAGLLGPVDASVVGPALVTLDAMPTLVLHRDGSSSTDAQLYISSRNAAPRDFRAIRLAPTTGRLTWFRYTGSAWKEAGR